MGKRRNPTRIAGAAVLGTATIAAGLALASGPALGGVLDAGKSLADITLARSLLGFEPRVGFQDGLRRSIDYYRSLAAG